MTVAVSPIDPSVKSLAADRSARIRALGRLLRHASTGDADVLLAGLARMLDAHIGHDHGDDASNGRIRDQLDEIELLLALEIERAGVRVGPLLSSAA
ncbi:hypothetical protein [Stenotrophomonas oahuensis]|uniref:Uncharacterized protein n=1 Tax=Stenotrophomonas oahuensis TaxID=3003271 RepID=A0ABY9YT45_9GAMM|nr:hypothetical protein [Stenotrophomonas sp. A5586]WNH54129.1 hypothetical protein PDM29_07585 [Stenotrophomonas sp. A5586]